MTIPQDIKTRAYELFSQGNSVDEQLTVLEITFKNPPSRRALFYLQNQFKQVKDSWLLDQPFEWHYLDGYKIPWQASAYLFEIWHIASLFGSPNISGRHMKWSWRVNQACPKLNIYDVLVIGYHFCFRDIGQMLETKSEKLKALKDLGYFSGLESWLLYHPWCSEANLKEYNSAISQKRIHPLPAIKIVLKTVSLNALNGRGISEYPWEMLWLSCPTPDHPDWLPSSLLPDNECFKSLKEARHERVNP